MISNAFDSSTKTGIATYYGGNDNGNACGYSEVPSKTFPYHFYAAGGGNNDYPFTMGYGCGLCFQVWCTGPYSSSNTACECSGEKVTIQIMDQCPECESNHFDLNPDAMAEIVGDGLSGTCGKIYIKYKQVECDYTGNFVIRLKSGTSKYWMGLFVDDVAEVGGVKGIQLLSNGDTVGNCYKTSGNPSFFQCDATGSNYGDPPLDVKLTDLDGNTITAGECITSFSGNSEFQCNTNFGGKNTAFTEDDDGDSSDKLSWSEWLGIIICILVVIGCIIFGVYWMIKRRKEKVEVAFDDKYEIGDTPEPKETENKDVVQEIEVETTR